MGVYDVNSEVGGYGSAGGAAFRGFQQELLRAAAMKQMAEEQQRRDAQTALDAEMKRAALANTQENTKSLVEERKSQTAKNALAAATAPLSPGQALTPEQSTALKTSGGGGFILGKPATPALEAGGPIENLTPEDITATPAVEAQPASETFAGTPAQREKDTQDKALQHIIDTTDASEPIHQWALTQQTGKAAPPGMIVPKPGPAEKAADRYLDISTRAQTKPDSVTPEETAFAKAYETQHPTEATRQKDKLQGLDITVHAANARQEAGFTNKAVEEDYKSLTDDYNKNVHPMLTRAVKLVDSLAVPGGVNDVIAIPEFLSVMAGGQGSGLRMTQTELAMIQNARPGTESVWIKLKNLAGNYTALTPAQREQMKTLVRSVAEHQIQLGERYAAAKDEIQAAKSGAESHKILTNLMRADIADVKKSLGTGGSAGPAEGTLGTVNGKPAVWKNGSKGLGWYAR